MISQTAAAIPAASDVPQVRTITSADLNWALAEGWRDFREKRGHLVFLGLIYPVICLVAIFVTFNQPLLPLLFPLVAGVSIAGPAVASGFYELARRREEGRNSEWWHFLDPLKGKSAAPIATLTAMMAVLFAGWLLVAFTLYAVTIGGAAPHGVGAFADALFGTPQGWTLIVLGNLAGFVFAVATLVFGVASFPMVVDKDVDAGEALATSWAAARANPRPVFGWGLRVAALLVLGCLPAGIGLAVIFPWLGYATWHLYTRLVVR